MKQEDLELCDPRPKPAVTFNCVSVAAEISSQSCFTLPLYLAQGGGGGRIRDPAEVLYTALLEGPVHKKRSFTRNVLRAETCMVQPTEPLAPF